MRRARAFFAEAVNLLGKRVHSDVDAVTEVTTGFLVGLDVARRGGKVGRVRPVHVRREQGLGDDDNVGLLEVFDGVLFEVGVVLDDDRLERGLCKLLDLVRPLLREMLRHDDERRLDRDPLIVLGQVLVRLPARGDEAERDGGLAVTDGIGNDTATDQDFARRLAFGGPAELRDERLGDFLFDPRLRVGLLLDHPVKRAKLLPTQLVVLEPTRILRFGVVTVAQERKHVRVFATESHVGGRVEAPFDLRFRALEVAVRRKLGEDPVRETDDVQADLELEVVADLPRVDDDGLRAVFERLSRGAENISIPFPFVHLGVHGTDSHVRRRQLACRLHVL